MYYPYFLTYMALGLGITLIVFAWALKNGQFKEQQRARFLPLHEAPDPRRPGRPGSFDCRSPFCFPWPPWGWRPAGPSSCLR